ncbi:MAG: energy-coupling factor transporter transmembrane component T [bacterium]|nr:energy-coupling factor transporter transmembrane component T [bacterium]
MAFLQDITLGQYYPADSFVHRLDPRTKIMGILASMIALIAAHTFWELLISFALLLAVIIISKLPPLLVLRNLKPFIWLFLITLIFHILLFSGGTILATVPLLKIHIYREGLLNGLLYSVRLAEFVLLAAVLTLTTSPMEITDALDRFLSPFKKIGLPTHEFVLMITLALRFIPTLISEADRLRKAQLSRGAVFEGNLLQRLKSVIPLIVPLFISVFKRADELAIAMDSRCYVGGKNRTSFKMLTFGYADYVVFIGLALYVLIFFIICG